MKSERHLTVSGTMKYTSNRTCMGMGAQEYPSLRITGRWLEECGFPIGCRASLKVSKGKIIITPEA